MPYINIKATFSSVTKYQKRRLIEGATQPVVDILNKKPETTQIVIDEVPTDNWGVNTKMYSEIKKKTDMENKTAIITGAPTGIDRAIAKHFMVNFQIDQTQKIRKTLNSLFLFGLVITSNLLHAQGTKDPKFDLMSYGGIGYGVMESENGTSYNLNSNSIDILLNYKLNEKLGIASGIGIYQLSGNIFNTEGNFYQKRMIAKVPLLATLKTDVSKKLTFIANFGLFTQVITKDNYKFLSSTHNDIYDGWNFGAQAGVSFIFNLSKNFGIGLQYMEHYELSKFKTTNNSLGLSDSQKMNARNSIGVLFMFTL